MEMPVLDVPEPSVRGPILISRLKLGSSTNRKGWNHLQTESRRMIVADKDDHIWLGFLHPLLGKFITFEKRCQ